MSPRSRRPLVLAAPLAVTVALVLGCESRESRSAPPPAGMDSLAGLDSLELAVAYPGAVDPQPAAGDWADVTVIAGDGFSLAVPAVARAANEADTTRDAVPARVRIGPLPGCRYGCAVTLTVHRDSAGLGLDGWVAREVERHDAAADPDWRVERPVVLDMVGAPAVLLTVPCGDCTQYRLFTGGAGRIAEFEYGFDDREPDWRTLGERVIAMASTLRWSGRPE